MKRYRNFKPAARLLATSLVLMFGCVNASAAVLGTVIDTWGEDMGGGAVYTHNTYNDPSVGSQTENYVEYKPNPEAVPIVVNGASVYGKRTITSAADYMRENNLRPLIGINADFFSLKTGIPMGYTIIDGKIYSKESGVQDAVGFRDDGTAFIDKLDISATLSKGDTSIDILYINKWPQKDFSWVYMLTDDYGASTHTNFDALYVVCSATEGDLSLNTSMRLKVDEVFEYGGDVKIPKGKYTFVMDSYSNDEYFRFLSSFKPGDEIIFTNKVSGADKHDWTEARYATSSIGGRLIADGEIGSDFEAGAAPRTAVGIKENGNVIFYTLDGRQKGYSYGARLQTLAKRMKELGCVDAINLDGGGSTAIGAVFPGTEEFKVTNMPSDGVLRSCANYIFLRDMREATGIPWHIDWKDIPNHNFLAGTDTRLEALSVYDSGNYKMDGLSGVEYSAENEGGAASEVTADGVITLKGTGRTNITVSSPKYSKTFSYSVFEEPDDIKIFDEITGLEVTSLAVAAGGMHNVNLEASAYVNGIRLESLPSLFKWEIDGTIGSVNEDGNVSLKDDGSGEGQLRVTANGVMKEIPITVIKKDTYDDIAGHWAHDIIEEMSELGIINGYEEGGRHLFRPDRNITRVQFAAIMCKSLGIDPNEYSDMKLNFIDNDSIQPWAENYVKAMVCEGYIGGKSDDGGKTLYLDPENSITRAEAFTIIGRTLDNDMTCALSFSDSGKIPLWAQQSVAKLAAMGIIQGFEDNSIRPYNLTTRAEAAALVNKLMKTK